MDMQAMLLSSLNHSANTYAAAYDIPEPFPYFDHDMSETGPDTHYREKETKQLLRDLEAERLREEYEGEAL